MIFVGNGYQDAQQVAKTIGTLDAQATSSQQTTYINCDTNSSVIITDEALPLGVEITGIVPGTNAVTWYVTNYSMASQALGSQTFNLIAL